MRRLVELREGTEYIYTQSCVDFNPEERNNAIENFYYVDTLECTSPPTSATATATTRAGPATSTVDSSTSVPVTDEPSTPPAPSATSPVSPSVSSSELLRKEVLATLLAHILSEPCFDQLRTKEQLGYIVHTAVKKVCYTVHCYTHILYLTYIVHISVMCVTVSNTVTLLLYYYIYIKH